MPPSTIQPTRNSGAPNMKPKINSPMTRDLLTETPSPGKARIATADDFAALAHGSKPGGVPYPIKRDLPPFRGTRKS